MAVQKDWVHAEKKRGRLCVTRAGGQMQDETKRELFGLDRALPLRSERLEGLLRVAVGGDQTSGRRPGRLVALVSRYAVPLSLSLSQCIEPDIQLPLVFVPARRNGLTGAQNS
jgi:hypothetical protein